MSREAEEAKKKVNASIAEHHGHGHHGKSLKEATKAVIMTSTFMHLQVSKHADNCCCWLQLHCTALPIDE